VQPSEGCNKPGLIFINEPLCVFLVAFYLFGQFLDRFRVGFSLLVKRMPSG